MKHQNSKPVHPEVRIGHVHLKVADLDRALAFYRDPETLAINGRYSPEVLLNGQPVNEFGQGRDHVFAI